MEIEYKRKKYLQTAAERNFFLILRDAIKDSEDIIVAPQVHLERVVNMTCQPLSSQCEYYVRNGFNTLSFDFVLFNKSFTPLLAIELDDLSHGQPSRRRRDSFIEQVCNEAGLGLWRIKRQDSYDVSEIKKEILSRIRE